VFPFTPLFCQKHNNPYLKKKTKKKKIIKNKKVVSTYAELAEGVQTNAEFSLLCLE
jgi:hypothetical protein